MNNTAVRGKIHDSKSLFLRVEVGDAETDGKTYHLTVLAGDYSPMVESGQTRKSFHLGWQDIINMALEAGIDEPEPEIN